MNADPGHSSTNNIHNNDNNNFSHKVQLDHVAHVHYQHPDLAKTHRFLLDFGLTSVLETPTRIYYSGFGAQPYIYVAEQSPNSDRAFVGGAWVVKSYADLELAAGLPNASEIQEADGPGGGKVVIVKDPNGFEMRLLHGQEPRQAETPEQLSEANTASKKPRKGAFVRIKPSPCKVHKLGHYGYCVKHTVFQDTLKWYTSHFNMSLTDVVYDPSLGMDTTCFYHIDKGVEYTDHHSFFLAAQSDDKSNHVHHSSFEVLDMDSEYLGHDWLRGKGWVNAWGVGRHVLGSQIFDYWFDASGNIVEHYSDGDLVNSDTPVSRLPEAPETLFVWGPNIPLAFLTGNVEDANSSIVLQPPDVELSMPAVLAS
ncbi:MAG: hypothetical protein M1834_001188 [Cirrosporium novae-zelandiae]|nr:MAG: hypothetical protein M1834_001188 [Cirrosporium novae-zelandiae]